MRRLMRASLVLPAVFVLVGIAALTLRAGDPSPAKAAALIPQSGQGETLKASFNAAADRVRLMVLLSPT